MTTLTAYSFSTGLLKNRLRYLVLLPFRLYGRELRATAFGLIVSILLLGSLSVFLLSCGNTGTRESAQYGRHDLRAYNHSIWLHGDKHSWWNDFYKQEVAESVRVEHDVVWAMLGGQALPESDLHIYGDQWTFIAAHQKRSNATHVLPIEQWPSLSGNAYLGYIDLLPDGSGDGSIHIMMPILSRRTFLGFYGHLLIGRALYKTHSSTSHPQVQWAWWEQQLTIAAFALYSQRNP